MNKLSRLITTKDLNMMSKSFGMAGSSAIKGNKIIVLTSNDNEPVFTKEMVLNKPLVKMINALASIDGFLKQKLDNQKIIAKNNQLSAREDIIENRNAQPQIEVIEPDAEKVNGGSAGLLALGGLALLTLDPVQEALKAIIDGVVNSGTFITDMVTSVNGMFDFLLGGGGASTELTPNATPVAGGAATTSPQESTTTPSTPTESQPPVESTSPVTGVASSALTGGIIGSLTRVGGGRGAIIGAGLYAASRTFGGGTSSAPAAAPVSAPSSSAGAPSATPTASASTASPSAGGGTPAASTTPAASATGIPTNDTNDRAAIARLGHYLRSQGISVTEHPDFDSSISSEHATNSRHYRGLALDLNISSAQEGARFDALQPQLRAAGYNTIWRQKGHETHMHVSVGGPEGGGGGGGRGYSELASSVSSVANVTLEAAAKLFGALGAAIIEPGVPRTDVAATISMAARELNADVAMNRTPEPPAPPAPPVAPRINRTEAGPTQNPPTTADRNSVYYYLRRFGYQNLSTPESTLSPAA